MSADPNKKSARTFQCRDVLWETFEQMARELECSIDYLINESMKQYARQRSYSPRTPFPGQVSPSSPAPAAPSAPGAVAMPPQPAPTPAPPVAAAMPASPAAAGLGMPPSGAASPSAQQPPFPVSAAP